ncbi:MAG: integral rane protein [Frankiales bacterium]|jgi:integral membrane protein|nr:integral rane protein [Frankiales bacterium]
MKYQRSVLAYRVLAFATGVVLLTGTITLIIQKVGDVNSIKTGVGFLWVGHGYLYLLYVIATLNLGIKLRWSLPRMLLIALAGTIPTMSFVAEHLVMRGIRQRQLASQSATAAASSPAAEGWVAGP